MERVLLLNQSYEPISIITWKKTIILLTLNKVEVVDEYNKCVHSKFLTMRLPAVVRLLKHYERPKKRVKFNKQNILARDRYQCKYCGTVLASKDLTYDHVIPKSVGGKTDWSNIVTCCRECNAKKGDRTPQEAGMRLKKIPSRPYWTPILSSSLSDDNIPDQWKVFCFFKD